LMSEDRVFDEDDEIWSLSTSVAAPSAPSDRE
jgi:hypothetical protein